MKACTDHRHGNGDDGDCWHGTIGSISEIRDATHDAKAENTVADKYEQLFHVTFRPLSHSISTYIQHTATGFAEVHACDDRQGFVYLDLSHTETVVVGSSS